MLLTFSARSLGSANSATTLTGYRTDAPSCLVAAALHVDLAEDREDPQLIPLLGDVLRRSAGAAPRHSPADLLTSMHKAALRTGRYYSGVAICGHGPAITLAQSGLVAVQAVTSGLRPLTEPDILAGQRLPILTAGLGTRQFHAPVVVAADLRESLAVFVGGTAAAHRRDSLLALPGAPPDPVSRGGLVLFIDPAAGSQQPTTRPMRRPETQEPPRN